jgi:hypothetical protein
VLAETRLQKALTNAARRYAPALLTSRSSGTPLESDERLAAGLARNHVLVIGGSVPVSAAGMEGVYVSDWVGAYLSLYSRICAALFPSYLQVSAEYADDTYPPLVLIHGEVMPVIDALACCIAPFVAARQGQAVSDMELGGLMDHVLERLEADDLPREEFAALRRECIQLVRQLLESPVRQQRITPADPQLGLSELPPPPADLPEAIHSPPPMPDTLPESDFSSFRAGEVPVFFDVKRASAGRPVRRPPVPDLPERS